MESLDREGWSALLITEQNNIHFFSLLLISTGVSQRYGIKDTNTWSPSKPASENLVILVLTSRFCNSFTLKFTYWCQRRTHRVQQASCAVLVFNILLKGILAFRLQGSQSKQWMNPSQQLTNFKRRPSENVGGGSLDLLCNCILVTDIRPLCRPLRVLRLFLNAIFIFT